MSRMFDRTQSMAQGFAPSGWVNSSWDREFRELRTMILPVLRSAQVFAIDHVCEYCYTSIEEGS